MDKIALQRTELLLGTEAVQRLRESRVVVAGLGAVGSYAVEALARAGVTRLRLADRDRVHPSNINRQLYALHSTVGQPKPELAAARVRDIDPGAEVEAWEVDLDEHTIPALLDPPPDLLIDAIDSLQAKVTLLHLASRAGIPVISSMGAATRLDPSCIHVGALEDSHTCPLARLIRKHLRRRGPIRGIRCVYSSEPGRKAFMEEESDPLLHGRSRPRHIMGSVSYMTGLFGLRVAGEALRMLLGDTWPQPE